MNYAKIIIYSHLIILSLYAKIDEKKAFQYDACLQTYGEVLSLCESRYFGELDPKKVISNSIKGFVDNLDPHSSLLETEEFNKLSTQINGEFSGIGAVFPIDNKKDEEFIQVIEIVDSGPADKAGLRPSDKIIQINDDLVRGMDIDEIMSKLRGPKDTTVILKVLRENQADPLIITITRDIIKDETALAYYFPDHKVHYLLLSIFSEKSAEHVKAFMEKALKAKSQAVIIDLRNNTGGLFDSAINIASFFLPKGTEVVSIKDRNGKVMGSWKTTSTSLKIPQGFPIFFIVNNYTASAAEILAGTLQLYAQKSDNPFVFIVGTETFGKGSVQEVIPLANDCALKLTTGLYYLPFDTCIQGKGIVPDFDLEYRTPPTETMRWMTSTYGKESGLKGHIKPYQETSLKEQKEALKKDAEIPWAQKRREFLKNDYFVQNTCNLIRLLVIGTDCNPYIRKKRGAVLNFLRNNYFIDTEMKLKEIKL